MNCGLIFLGSEHQLLLRRNFLGMYEVLGRGLHEVQHDLTLPGHQGWKAPDCLCQGQAPAYFEPHIFSRLVDRKIGGNR